MTVTAALTRTILKALLYGCLLWSAVMIGASNVHNHDALGPAGSAALSNR